ncbi:unnamed protein product [Trifolium pratense]|uniref:Uncharacterized protein n=1 Tax=Trifolium pratense TaxID=57577 RepID=A0ACB0K858_TRIPR|nr:unnamed protein product [Trifolium pratense]
MIQAYFSTSFFMETPPPQKIKLVDLVQAYSSYVLVINFRHFFDFGTLEVYLSYVACNKRIKLGVLPCQLNYKDAAA